MQHKITRIIARVIFIFTLIFASLPMYTTFAATQECAKLDKSTLEFYAKNNILYYCPKTIGTSTGVVCTSVSSGTGDNVSKAFGFFIESGYDKTAAAAIVGNLMQESTTNLDPYIRQDKGKTDDNWRAWDNGGKTYTGGFGIAQWDYYSRVEGLQNYADSKNLPVTSLQVQLEYVLVELTGRGVDTSFAVPPSAVNGRTLEDAVEVIRSTYERGTPGNRLSFAQQVLGLEPSNPGFATECVDVSGGSGTPTNIDGINIYNQYALTFTDGSYTPENSCGPVSFAMAASALGKNVDPVEAAAYAASRGQYVPGAGSSWTITEVLASHYGFRAQPVSPSAISSVLEQGGVVHCSGQGPHPFTGGGHFIAIVGMRDGQWLVADSNGGSLKTYDPNSVIPYVQNAKAVYAN